MICGAAEGAGENASGVVTKAMTDAFAWLKARNGTGVFAERNRQVLLAAGERGPFRRNTWKRLAEAGLVAIDGRRVTIVDAGVK